MDRLVAYVCRHGESPANINGIIRSWKDTSLDSHGMQQAFEASDFLKGKPIEQVICSPLLRAFQTANAIAGPHNLVPYQTRGLFPWNMGVFCGLPKEENSKAVQLFVDNPTVRIPNGESLDIFEERQFLFWKAAFEESKLRLTAFVTHSSSMTSLVKFTQESDEDNPLALEIVKPGGIVEVYFDGTNYRTKPVFGIARSAKFGSA